MQRLQVFQDVAGLGRDEHDKEVFQRLVHVPHAVSLDKRVLLAQAHELGERRQEPLHARARHLHKLARHEGCGTRSPVVPVPMRL